jgi:hypothetical protein
MRGSAGQNERRLGRFNTQTSCQVQIISFVKAGNTPDIALREVPLWQGQSRRRAPRPSADVVQEYFLYAPLPSLFMVNAMSECFICQ